MLDNKQISAIICECNPFHEGHKKIIELAKKKYGSDILIAIMSGDFVQRGEPSIFNKYDRAKTLLENNVDLVIEIPVEFSLSSAKYFARAAINIINKLGFVDNIIFGCSFEGDGGKNILKNTSKTLRNPDENSNNMISSYLKSGLSYPLALSKTFNINILPNDILAIEYINAINDLNANIDFINILRTTELKGASQIRETMVEKINIDDFTDYLNQILFFNYNNDIKLTEFYDIDNDLSNAINNNADKKISISDRVKLLATKNRTYANIKRSLLHILLNIKQDDIKILDFGFNIPFIKILGIKKEKEFILKNINYPFLTSYSKKFISSFYEKYDEEIKNNIESVYVLIKNNTYASNLYASVTKNPLNEMTQKFLII